MPPNRRPEHPDVNIIELDREQRHGLGQLVLAMYSIVDLRLPITADTLVQLADMLDRIPHVPGITLQLGGLATELAAAAVIDQQGHRSRQSHPDKAAIWDRRYEILTGVAETLAAATEEGHTDPTAIWAAVEQAGGHSPADGHADVQQAHRRPAGR